VVSNLSREDECKLGVEVTNVQHLEEMRFEALSSHVPVAYIRYIDYACNKLFSPPSSPSEGTASLPKFAAHGPAVAIAKNSPQTR